MSIKIIGYLSYGFPSIERSIERADAYISGGCDCIEIDLPTPNAFLDSDLIKSNMKQAYENCSDFDRYFEGISIIKNKHKKVEFIILVYESTVKEIGVDKFIENLKKLDLYNLIFVGMENQIIKNKLISNGIKISCYVPFELNQEDIDSALNSNGFVYLQAKSNGKVRGNCETLEKCVQYLKQSGIKNDIYCGVGVSTPEDIKIIKKAKANGAFIGSALLKKQSKDEIIDFIKSLKDAT